MWQSTTEFRSISRSNCRPRVRSFSPRLARVRPEPEMGSAPSVSTLSDFRHHPIPLCPHSRLVVNPPYHLHLTSPAVTFRVCSNLIKTLLADISRMCCFENSTTDIALTAWPPSRRSSDGSMYLYSFGRLDRPFSCRIQSPAGTHSYTFTLGPPLPFDSK